MNRIGTHLLILAILLIASDAYSQAFFKAEVIGGFNLSQVDGDETAGFRKLGLNTGLGVMMPFNKHWAVGFETLYSQKGSRQGKIYYDSLDGSYKLKLHYAEVPLMIQYTDRDFMSVGLGLSWGRLVMVDEWKNGYKVDSVTLRGGPFSRDDFEGFFDVRFRLYQNLKINARYSYTLPFTPIATRNIRDSMSGRMNIRDFYNNYWSIRLVYMINESPPDKKKKSAPNP